MNRYSFESNNPQNKIDKSGHNPVLVGLGFIALVTAISAGNELATQLIYTGTVYSWGRVGDSALEGAAVSASIILAASNPYGGIVVSGIIFEAYNDVVSNIDQAKSYEAALEYKRIHDANNKQTSVVSTTPTIKDQTLQCNYIYSSPSTSSQPSSISSGRTRGYSTGGGSGGSGYSDGNGNFWPTTNSHWAPRPAGSPGGLGGGVDHSH